jgi:hypothetical protein
VRKLATWRKNQPVIHTGRLMHFGPENNTWVYFRYNDNKRVMVAMNNNAKEWRCRPSASRRCSRGRRRASIS